MSESVTGAIGPTMASLTQRGMILLEDGLIAQARDCLHRALEIEPTYAPAYVGLLLAQLGLKTESELGNVSVRLEDLGDYQKAIRFGDDALRARLEAFARSAAVWATAQQSQSQRRSQEARDQQERKVARDRALVEAFLPFQDPLKAVFGTTFTYGGQIDAEHSRLLVVAEDCVVRLPFHAFAYLPPLRQQVMPPTDGIQPLDHRRRIPWQVSSIRAWLNNEFFRDLPRDLQPRIVQTALKNRANPMFKPVDHSRPGFTGDMPDTLDRVFLLSYEEFEKAGGQKYGKVTHAGQPCWWWLRTAGADNYDRVNRFGAVEQHINYLRLDRAAFVHEDGTCDLPGRDIYSGDPRTRTKPPRTFAQAWNEVGSQTYWEQSRDYGRSYLADAPGGVRPAFWVDLTGLVAT